MINEIDKRIRKAMSRFSTMVELVTDLVFNDDGTATGKGLGDADIESSIGYHFGFYSRPKDGARGLVVKADGQGNTSILVGFRDVQYELSLEKGECGMQNAFSASVLLNKNGEIILNGGSAKVARVGDHAPAGTLTIGAVGTTAVTVTYVDPDGTTTGPTNVTGAPTAFSLKAKINEGANKVKA